MHIMKVALLLWALVKLHLCTYRRMVSHFESKEYHGKVCAGSQSMPFAAVF